MQVDKAGKSYWDEAWRHTPLPKAVNPKGYGISNYITRRFHEYFIQTFKHIDTKGKRFLEIGCAKSVWLPYFAKEFGFQVSGIDYSEVGCVKAKEILEKENVAGEIICADLFSPPLNLLGAYDVVVSFGVVEHFEDTCAVIAALAKYVKNNGIIITNIPNMVGHIGLVQKKINRPVYDIHQQIDCLDLARAHECAGMGILKCDYFISTSYGICNLIGLPENTASWFIKKIALAGLTRLSYLVWYIEEKTTQLKANRYFAPYINCVAKKISEKDRQETGN